MMGWLFIIIGLVFIGIVVFVYLKSVPKPNLTPEEKPDIYQDQAQPGQGIFHNINTRINARSDTKTQEVVNVATRSATEGITLGTEAVHAKLEKEALPERHEQTLQKEKAETETILAQHRTIQKEAQLREKLIDIAMALGYDIDTYLQQQRNNLDIEKLEQETMTKLKGGFVFQLQEYQKLTMLRGQLDSLYEREYEILNSNEADSVKQKKLRQVKKDIQMLEKDANGRRTGLVQIGNGKEIRGSYTDSDD